MKDRNSICEQLYSKSIPFEIRSCDATGIQKSVGIIEKINVEIYLIMNDDATLGSFIIQVTSEDDIFLHYSFE